MHYCERCGCWVAIDAVEVHAKHCAEIAGTLGMPMPEDASEAEEEAIWGLDRLGVDFDRAIDRAAGI